MTKKILPAIPDEAIINKIYIIREQKVMLDRDLAVLYGVETKVLKQAVKRNLDIFPDYFMFELNNEEFKNLRSQIVTSSWGGQRYLPFAFTEHGILQLANVLRSPLARKMSVRIIDVFIKMREMLNLNRELFKKLSDLEKKYIGHDDQIMLLFEYINRLEETKQQELEQAKRKRIGYRKQDEQ